MASFTTTRKTAWADVSSSGALGTPRNPKTNTPSTDAKWLRVRGQISRAYIADPDCFFYQTYLSSNRQYGLALELKDAITALLQYAEGALYPSTAAPVIATPPTYLAGNTSTEGISETADILAQRAKAAAATSKIGRRLAERGEEAKSLYLARVDAFVQQYFTFQTALSLIADSDPDFEPLRQFALVDVQVSADAAVATTYSSSTAAEFAVQNAAAAAALRTSNRVPSARTRFSYTQVFFPTNVAATVSGTTITFTTQSPAYCYLRVGDVFSWAGGETTITAVGTTTATLAADVGTPAGYAITPGAYAVLETLKAACAAFLSANETASKSFRAKISDLSSSQRIREVIALLAATQSAITGLSTEAVDILERLGITEPVAVTTIGASLYGYAPVVSSGTKESTKSCLDTLKREGFQLAAQRFLSANLTFLSETSDMQQLAGLFDATMDNRT